MSKGSPIGYYAYTPIGYWYKQYTHIFPRVVTRVTAYWLILTKDN